MILNEHFVICPFCNELCENQEGLNHLIEEIYKVDCKIDHIINDIERSAYLNTLTRLLAKKIILESILYRNVSKYNNEDKGE